MSSDNHGANPMRWDCEKQGCFNRKKRLKLEMLADCLPGKIAFTDIDAITELCGNFLILEWKSHGNVPAGQRILFQRITRLCPATVFLVEGDAEFMSVSKIRVVWHGRIMHAVKGDFELLRTRIKKWAEWAQKNPAIDDAAPMLQLGLRS